MGTDHKSGLLLRILELDQQKIEETGFIPAWFEFSFGRNTKGHKNKESILNPVLLSFAGKELLITGSIDRIDIHPDGRAIVLDYKTGSGSTRVNVKHFLRGTHHQLPLYALAFKKLYSGSKVAYAGYFLIKSEKECKYIPAMMDSSCYEFYKNRSVSLLPNPEITNSGGEPLSFDQLLEKNLETAILQVNELKQGHFHHTQYPGEEQCQKYCEFRRMCRKNTAKIEYLGGEGK
jgi:ATP-dependent helicase/DNAse subunit B